MANTKQPVTTVTWNSETFLLNKLKQLEDNHVIEWWAYIYHLAEEDEKKEHAHLIMQPNLTINTAILRDEFTEEDLNNPDKPIRCLPFNVISKKNISDWYLYCLHDPSYLMYKDGQSRQHLYSKDFVVCSDENLLDHIHKEAYTTGDFAKHCRQLKLLQDPSYTSASQLIDSGLFHLNQASSIYAYNLLKTCRNGRSGHGDEAPD